MTPRETGHVKGGLLPAIGSEHSPGPKYGVDSHLTSRGHISLPHISMKGRHFYKPKTTQHTNPGPDFDGKSVTKLSKYRSGSKFTMGGRNFYNPDKGVPGPNSYMSGHGIGKVHDPHIKNVPKFTASTVIPKQTGYAYDFAKTPGPAAYHTGPVEHSRERRVAAFSLGPRTKLPVFKTTQPGPGAYNPQQSVNLLKKGPGFSFGGRQSKKVMRLLATGSDIPDF